MSSRFDLSENVHNETPKILGEVVIASKVQHSDIDPKRASNIIILLAFCVAIMMTGFGIIYPVFGRRLGELGGGVRIMGWMTMSFAFAQLLFAPLMGTLADRYGRRPVILVGLVAFAFANLGFLFARETGVFIVVRAIEGALSAGVFPAAMGVVGDTVPEDERARWVGIVMGSYAAGFFLGPIFGGVLYDSWGYKAPFLVSAILGAAAFILAVILVPETRTQIVRNRDRLSRLWQESKTLIKKDESIWASLPRPLYLFATLLFIDFMMIFTFAFTEPQMVFYFYDQLGFSTIQFGIIVGAYGLIAVIGQGYLGRLSDRYGRNPIIITGLLMNGLFYASLALVRSFPLLFVGAMIAGLGEALVMPALSAFYLDITAERHRSRMMGFKESAASLGGVLGPLFVIGMSLIMTPEGIFYIALILMLITAVLAIVVLRTAKPVPAGLPAVSKSYTIRQAMAAQSALRSVVITARAARDNTS